MKTQSEIEREIDDIESEAAWLIQHGHESESFASVKAKLDALAHRRKTILGKFQIIGRPMGQCMITEAK